MRRLTAILLFVPVALVLLAPPAAPASAQAEPEPGLAGPGCPHEQESHQPSAPAKSQHDCHRCCVSLVAGTVAPGLGVAGPLPLTQQHPRTIAAAAPAEPEAAVLCERGPPSS